MSSAEVAEQSKFKDLGLIVLQVVGLAAATALGFYLGIQLIVQTRAMTETARASAGEPADQPAPIEQTPAPAADAMPPPDAPEAEPATTTSDEAPEQLPAGGDVPPAATEPAATEEPATEVAATDEAVGGFDYDLSDNPLPGPFPEDVERAMMMDGGEIAPQSLFGQPRILIQSTTEGLPVDKLDSGE